MASERHDSNDADERRGLPPISRLDRGGNRRYRVRTRAGSRYQRLDRYPRQRKHVRLAELIGMVIRRHRLTDELRQQVVGLYWREIAGERIAAKTCPLSVTEGVLHVAVINSSWLHEVQFFKADLIARINLWIDAQRVWLGPPAPVTDVRLTLDTPRRQPLVDPEQARQLRLARVRQSRPAPEITPRVPSSCDREAILRETSGIADTELRAVVEWVRMKWNL